MPNYASTIDVAAIDSARATYSATSKPSASQVHRIIGMIEGEVNAILRHQGYALPIPTTATYSLDFLRAVTAKGAMALIEQSAVTSDRRGDARAMWQEAKSMLKSTELDAPKDPDSSLMRWAPQGATPFISRDTEL